MRFVQYKILKEVLEPKFNIPEYIYAFEKDKSIPAMARVHEGAFMVVSLDVKDFFPSIKQREVQRLMEGVGFDKASSKTLSELMTLGPNVPQGGLTSPKLSNIVAANTFGPEILKYCQERELQLTIYADDVTISSKSEFRADETIAFVTETLRKYGFMVNKRKTKVMRKGTRNSRLYVCGTVVNEKVNLLKQERLRLRAIVHNCAKNGIEAEAAKNELTPNEFVMRIRGKLNWFGQLNAEGAAKLVERFKAVCTDWESVSQSTPYAYPS